MGDATTRPVHLFGRCHRKVHVTGETGGSGVRKDCEESPRY